MAGRKVSWDKTKFFKLEEIRTGPRFLHERIYVSADKSSRRIVAVDQIRPQYVLSNNPKVFSINDLFEYQIEHHQRPRLTTFEEELVFQLVRDLRGEGHSILERPSGLYVGDFKPNNIVIGNGPFGYRAYLIDDDLVYEDSRSTSRRLYSTSGWIGRKYFWEKVPDFRNRLIKIISGGIRGTKTVDHAMRTVNPDGRGGIDFTAKRMKLDIDSDKSTVSQPMDVKALENIEINGLYIKDMVIKPLDNLQKVLGIGETEKL